MKDKKGFTLIELLAVIVILAIIMVIATMQVNKTIKKARQDSYEITAKELIKQIKGKIALGEEYRCFNGNGDSTVSEYSNSLTEFFGNNYKNLCNTSPDSPTKENRNNGLECKRDFGTNTCQNLYNLSDDYRMMVYYQPCTDKVYMFLDASFGNSKLKGITKTHNATFIEKLGQEDTEVKLYSNDYKIKVAENTIAYNKIVNKNKECEKDEKGKLINYSYECQLNLKSNEASYKKSLLNEKINNLTDVVKYNGEYYMGIEDACKFLYNN